jgi:hypothetical protein
VWSWRSAETAAARQPAKGAEGPPPIEPPLDGLQAYRERASHLGGSPSRFPNLRLGSHPAKLFSWLVFHRLTKAHTGTAAVFVDELHAGVLEGASNDIKGRAPRLCQSCLWLANGHLQTARGVAGRSPSRRPRRKNFVARLNGLTNLTLFK